MKRSACFALAALAALVSGSVHAAPAATGSIYDIAAPGLLPAADNVLAGKVPTRVGGTYASTWWEPQASSMSCVTDGAIPDQGASSGNLPEDRALMDTDGTLTWTWEDAEAVKDVRIYTQWADGWRCDVSVQSIEVLVGDTWTALENSSFSYSYMADWNTVSPYDGEQSHKTRRVVFADSDPAANLADAATGLRITFGNQCWTDAGGLGYGGYWEIEAQRGIAGDDLTFEVRNTVNGGTDYVGVGEVAVKRMPYALGYEEYQFTVGDAEPAADGWQAYTAGVTPSDVISFVLPQMLDAEVAVHCRLRGDGLADLDLTDTIRSAYGAQPTASVGGGISVLMANDYDGALVTAEQILALNTSSDAHGGIVSVTAEDVVVHGDTNLVLTVTNLAGNSASCDVPVTATVAGGALPANVFRTMLHLGRDVVNDSLTVPNGPDYDYLAGFGGQASQLPYAGLAYSGLSTVDTATTPGTLVWTAAEDDDGIWLDNVDRSNIFVKYWHVYVYSPDERDVTWRLKSDDYAYVFVNGEQQGFSQWTDLEYLTSDGHLRKGFNSITVKFYEQGGNEYVSVGLFARGTTTFLSDLTYSLEPPFLVKDASTGDIRKLSSGTVAVAHLPRVRDVTHYQIVQDNFFGDAEPSADGWLAYTPGVTPAGTLPLAGTEEDDMVFYTLFLRKADGTVVRRESASLTAGVRIGGVSAVGATASHAGTDSVLTFSESGTVHFSRGATVDVLVVGGGGGGGIHMGGGGGGGGVVYRQSLSVGAGTYQIVVGAGGAGAKWDGTVASANGGDSSAFGLVAYGGGAGGGAGYTGNGFYDGRNAGLAGASGGGAAGHRADLGGGESTPGDGVSGQGFAGGAPILQQTNGINNDKGAGGGGGGAGAAGGAAYQPDGADQFMGGDGGAGAACDITGAEVVYGGGGGGGSNYYGGEETRSSGGAGGGGRGGFMNSGWNNYGISGTDGTDGLGGGGGGAGSGFRYDADTDGAAGYYGGGRGGRGVVVIRFTPTYGEDSNPGRGGKTVTKKNGYMIHTFTESGKFSIPNSVVGQVLLVGGGGGGGNGYGGGGGGGAGGMLVVPQADIPAGNYEVVVGAGGLGGIRDREDGQNGGNSVFAGWTALGGGGGAGIYRGNGFDGGSGGGGFYSDIWSRNTVGGTGTPGQGHDGGSNTYADDLSKAFGAGGGGAGEAGYSSTTAGPGKGGDGLMCDITGEEVWYAGGGAGGTNANVGREETQAEGGKGGGGDSGYWPTGVDPVDHYGPSDNMAYIGHGTPGTGGGGGGGALWGNGADQGPGGNGGSGIVIIRYKLRPSATILIVR